MSGRRGRGRGRRGRGSDNVAPPSSPPPELEDPHPPPSHNNLGAGHGRSPPDSESQPGPCMEEEEVVDTEDNPASAPPPPDNNLQGKGQGNGRGGGKGKRGRRGRGRRSAQNTNEPGGGLDTVPVPMEEDEPPLTEEELAQQLLLAKVFQNELIFDTLGSFLNFQDCLALSQVSKGFCKLTRAHRPFTDRAKYIVSKEGYHAKAYTDSAYPWKTLTCHMENIPRVKSKSKGADKEQLAGSIMHSLAGAEHLELYHVMPPYELSTTIAALKPFFWSSPAVKSLSIELPLMIGCLSEIYEGRLEMLQNLEAFTILPAKSDIISLFVSTTAASFIKTLKFLTELPPQFKKLDFGTSDRGGSMEIVFRDDAVSGLIEKNQSTLTELALPVMTSVIRSIQCPSLTKLSVTAREGTMDVVVQLLVAHPLLTDLSIRARSGITQKCMETIGEKCSRLEKLFLKTRGFVHTPPLPRQPGLDFPVENWDAVEDPLNPVEAPEALPAPLPPIVQPIDISFLGELKGLKDFQLIQRSRRDLDFHDDMEEEDEEGRTYFNLGEIIAALPAQTVRSLSLAGMLSAGWVGDFTIAGIAGFSRFPRLVKLSLRNCRDTLNDEILRFILQSFTMLRVFELAGSRVSGAALTGVGTDGEVVSNVSLRDIKGLRSLVLVDLPEVDEASLTTAIQFLELTELDLRPSNGVSWDTMKQIILQNPSLARLTFRQLDSSEEMEKDIKRRIVEMKTRIQPRHIIAKNSYLIEPLSGTSDYGDDEDSDDWEGSDDFSYGSNGWDHDDFDFDDDFDGDDGYGHVMFGGGHYIHDSDYSDSDEFPEDMFD